MKWRSGHEMDWGVYDWEERITDKGIELSVTFTPGALWHGAAAMLAEQARQGEIVVLKENSKGE